VSAAPRVPTRRHLQGAARTTNPGALPHSHRPFASRRASTSQHLPSVRRGALGQLGAIFEGRAAERHVWVLGAVDPSVWNFVQADGTADGTIICRHLATKGFWAGWSKTAETFLCSTT
jgi:hypothetical protein